jgi:hypothetical protein
VITTLFARSGCVLAVAALVAVSAGGAAAAEGDIRFGVAHDYPAATVSSGLGAGAVSAADFDGDGKRDLVVSNCGGGGPSVLRNRGNAVFAPPSVVPSDYDACTVGTGDFNRDGNPDVVAGSYFSGNVTVLLGRGNGAFVKRWQGRSGNAPMQFAIADFNRDGRPDIASMNNSPGTVTMLLGNGNGTFRSLGEHPVANQAISIVAGDFNADRRPDLAVTDVEPDQTIGLLPGEVEVLLGKGDGTFGPRATYGVGGSPEYVDAGDLDHDGHLDLVVANAIYNNDVSILYGRLGGKFEPEQRIVAPGMGLRIAGAGSDGDPGLQVSDFDRDGHLDLAVIQTVAGKVVLLRGDGRRHFTPAGEYPAATLPESFLATDLTGDRYPDLAVPGNAPAGGNLSTRVSVLVNASGAGGR